MGLIVKQARIIELQNEIASTNRMAMVAMRMSMSKDPMQKELGFRQCEMLKEELLRCAARLRMLNQSSYLKQKPAIEQLYKSLRGCAPKQTGIINETSKEYVS